MSVVLARRPAPSFLWGMSDAKREGLLAQKDKNGNPRYEIAPIREDQVFEQPNATWNDRAVAKLQVLAELRQDEKNTSCCRCGAHMSPEYAKQICETCSKKDGL